MRPPHPLVGDTIAPKPGKWLHAVALESNTENKQPERMTHAHGAQGHPLGAGCRGHPQAHRRSQHEDGGGSGVRTLLLLAAVLVEARLGMQGPAPPKGPLWHPACLLWETLSPTPPPYKLLNPQSALCPFSSQAGAQTPDPA